MKFRIEKASYYTTEWEFNKRFNNDSKPCKNAVLEKDEHGIKAWTVEINSLEELLELRKEVNEELIIGLNGVITIYNDFIE